jgi:peptide/nickel transport system substrate-binding protein
MPPRSRVLIASLLFAMLASGCTSAGDPPPTPTPSRPGGTLRVGLLSSDSSVSGWCPLLICGRTYDPQSTSFIDVFELDRCCFMRTLLSYDGSSVADGGTQLRPDLARSLPTISPDGLSWTFRLRSGVHYAPPMARSEIVAADFIRSFERAFTTASVEIPWSDGNTIGGYWSATYLESVIAGVHEFTDGKADHVSGLQAPDPHTVVIHLNEPAGDLGYRLALPQFGPIPANPAHPGDPLGVAQGHDFDYGDMIVSTGPYMFEGSEKLSYALPPADQLPPSGLGFDTATLVRNPSWSRASDPVRKAWADRIEFSVVGSAKEGEQLVRDGSLDIVLNWATDAASTARFVADPTLRSRTSVGPSDGEHFLFLNLAIPPFDDLHVRRAMNMVVDRQAIASAFQEGGAKQEIFTHLALDSYEDNLLLSYSPPGVGASSNVAAARQEMSQSRYDTDHDGRCDAPACSALMLEARTSFPPTVRAAEAAVAGLHDIGLDFGVRKISDEEFFTSFGDPAAQVALRIVGWTKDYPSASTFFPLLLGADQIGGQNASMVGATPAQLRKYGYTVRTVPNVDGQISACQGLVFDAQTRCWARLDQYLSEQLVPWIPLTQVVNGWLVSSQVASFSVDASISTPMPALDNIQLDGTPSAPRPSLPPSPFPSIPDGVYRVTISSADIVNAGGAKDDDQGPGTYTVVLQGGRFRWHQRGDVPIFNPIGVGTFEGTGDQVRFHVQQPPDNSDQLSALTWRMEGHSIVFALPRCTGPAARDAAFCGFQKALFGAHPWGRVTEFSGGPF